MMMFRTTSRAVMIAEAEHEVERFKNGISKGFWKDMNYSDEEIAAKLDEYEKSVLLLKDEISFEEYSKAVDKVREFKGRAV